MLSTVLGGISGQPTVTVAETPTGTMSVVVRGLRNSDGNVLFVLFDDADAFPGDDRGAVRRAKRPIQGSVAKAVWTNVPHGTYAVAVVHDENDNEALDTNFLGMPKEGIGASNNAKARMGPPKWKDAKFGHGGAISTQVIKIKYL